MNQTVLIQSSLIYFFQNFPKYLSMYRQIHVQLHQFAVGMCSLIAYDILKTIQMNDNNNDFDYMKAVMFTTIS